MGLTHIRGCIGMVCLMGACQMLRTLPETVPLDFSCEAQLEATTLYIANQPKTKITLTLTPNDEGTRAISLSVADWHLPEGLHGLLWDEESKAITTGRPLSWGTHVWWYSPHNPGEHTLTLHFRAPYEEEPYIVALEALQVLDPEAVGTTVAGRPSSVSVSAWMRALTDAEQTQVQGRDKEVVALEVRLEGETVPGSFKLQAWQLPLGLEGVLENAAGERLSTFPLSTGEANTLFLCLDRGQEIQDIQEPLRLRVQGPDGVIQEKEVPLHWQQTSFPFDLSLTADSIELFKHQQSTITLTITPKDPQKQTEYSLTTLSLSHGELKGKSSGVVLTQGASLHAGVHQLLFSCATEEAVASEMHVSIKMTVRNRQGDQRNIEQVLVVKPIQFSLSAWMRSLKEEEQEQLGSNSQDVVALELRLEEVAPSLQAAPFKLQQWQLPNGVRGVLENAAGERLSAFPLSAATKNSLFLYLDKGSNYPASGQLLRLQVQGPGEVVRNQDVGLTLLQGKALERLMEEFKQLGLRVDDKNPGDYLGSEDLLKLRSGERIARDYIKAIRHVLDQATAYGEVDHLPGEMPRHYRALERRKEALERVQEQLGKEARIWSTIESWGGVAQTVEHFACNDVSSERDKECFRVALRKYGVNTKFSNGYTALHQAVENENEAAFTLLLEERAAINARGAKGETPLLFAVSRGNPTLIRLALEAKADPDLAMTAPGGSNKYDDQWGWAPLHTAAEKGDLQSLILLLKYGADPNLEAFLLRTYTRYHYYASPYYVAVQSATGHSDVSKKMAKILSEAAR